MPRRHHGLLRTLRDRWPSSAAPDEGAALLTVIMLIFVVGSLSVLVMGLVTTQVRSSQFAQKSGGTITAAQSGSQAALGALRDATKLELVDGKAETFGDATELVCSVQGSVPGDGPQLSYTTSIAYYTEDPSLKDAAWRASPANRLACGPGGVTGGTPRYALITTTALQDGVVGVTDAQGNRALTSTYKFQTSSINIPSGVFWTIGKGACLRAPGTSDGTVLVYALAATCNARGDDVLWIHDADNKIKLASTYKSDTEMCVSQAASGSAGVLRPCFSLLNQVPNQVWSYTGLTFSNGGGRCLWNTTKAAPKAGDPLTISTCNASGYNSWWTWAPEPAVGAGDSGYGSGQFVNYANFGSCFELTYEDITARVNGIAPCKHAGASSNTQNQVWYFTKPTDLIPTTTTTLKTKKGGSTACLGLSAPAANWSGLGYFDEPYPSVMPCNAADKTQTFTVIGKTGSYADSYLIKDYKGRCLGAGPIYKPGGFSYYTVIASACTGGPEQKWNAPANVTPGVVGNVRETAVTR